MKLLVTQSTLLLNFYVVKLFKQTTCTTKQQYRSLDYTLSSTIQNDFWDDFFTFPHIFWLLLYVSLLPSLIAVILLLISLRKFWHSRELCYYVYTSTSNYFLIHWFPSFHCGWITKVQLSAPPCAHSCLFKNISPAVLPYFFYIFNSLLSARLFLPACSYFCMKKRKK